MKCINIFIINYALIDQIVLQFSYFNYDMMLITYTKALSIYIQVERLIVSGTAYAI